MSRIKDLLKENIYIILVAVIYGGIYLYRMFTNNPWYDELYTYYSFISRGPVYAAIHWPLPNNHMGYSALSGFLSYFGNPTIALRGVSFCCALINVFLVHRLAKKWSGKRAAFVAVFVYCGVFEVHNMAVQGRGYTLSTTLYIIALLIIDKIINNEAKIKDYIIYILCLAYGIYAVPSSTFWVIPICIFGGTYLLLNKRIKDLIRLIIISAAAAVCALSAYLTVWLAIGSNLLCKDMTTAYFGMHQFEVIRKAPLLSAQTGLDYMLASPYIQSMDRNIVINGLFYYLEALFEQFYGGFGVFIIIFLAVTFVVALIRFIRLRQRVLELFLAVSIIMLPIMLIAQSVQPYLRVFSYFGLVVSLSLVMYIVIISNHLNINSRMIENILTAITGVLFIGILFTGTYVGPMADRENDIKDTWDGYILSGFDINSMDSVYYTDDYQKYVLKFFYDVDPREELLGEAQYVMVSDTMNDKDIEAIIWPMLTSYTTFDFDLLNREYDSVYSTEKYTIYMKRE